MSNSTIDNRIVKISLDNKNFEANADVTLSTLDKLKTALGFAGVATGMTGITGALSKIAKDPNWSAMEALATKSTFALKDIWIKTVSFLENDIARKLADTAKNITKSLTITPVFSGFDEYSVQMGAIQTIMSNTKAAFTAAGKDQTQQLQEVNAALDELNLYADKTIYNFTEMTNNIGRFTAAGIDLDTSVSAIKGISNLAAVSGSTSQQASTAMYQLSQALSTGTVRLMDWNSVVNANMGGKVFQDELVKTAQQMGIDAQALIDSAGSFRDSLSEGWLTSEVLTEALNHFSLAVDTEAEEAASRAQLAAEGYSQARIDEIIELAKDSADAATKVKTVSQLWDTMQESMQSGWTQTWEYIVGDFTEARETLSSVLAWFEEHIAAIANARNATLKMWHDMGGRQKMLEALSRAFTTLWDVASKVMEGFKSALPKLDGAKLLDLTTAFDKFTSSMVPSEKAMSEFGEIGKTLGEIFAGLGSIINNTLIAAIKGIFSAIKGSNVLRDISEWLKVIKALVASVADEIKRTFPIREAVEGITTIVMSLVTILTSLLAPILQAIFGFFEGKGTGNINKFITNVIKKIAEISKKLADLSIKFSEGPLTTFLSLLSSALTGLGNVVSDVISYFSDLGGYFDESISSGNGLIKTIGTLISKFGGDLKTAFSNLGGYFTPVTEQFDSLKESMTTFIDGSPAVSTVVNNIKDVFNDAKDAIATFVEKLTGFSTDKFEIDSSGVSEQVSGLGENIEKGLSPATKAIDKIKDFFAKIAEILSPAVELMKELFKGIGETFSYGFESIGEGLSSIGDDGLINSDTAAVTSGMVLIMYMLSGFMEKLDDLIMNFKEMDPSIITKTFKKLSEGITDFLDDIAEAANKFAQAQLLNSISDSILKVVVALLLLTLIPEDKIAAGIASMIVIFEGMLKMMKGLEKLAITFKKTQSLNLAILSGIMNVISAAFIEMAIGLVLISFIPSDKIIAGFGMIFLFTTMIPRMMKSLDSIGKTKSGNASGAQDKRLLAIGGTILLIAKAFRSIMFGLAVVLAVAKKPSELIVGAIAIVIIGVGIGLLMKALADITSNMKASKISGNTAKLWLSMGGTIWIIAQAMFTLALAIAILSLLPEDKMLVAVGVVAGLMTAMATLMAKLGELKPDTSGLKGFIALAAAVLILCLAVWALGSMDPDRLEEGVIAVGALMGELALLIGILAEIQNEAMEDGGQTGSLDGLSKVILSMAVAMYIIMKAVQDIGSMDPNAAKLGAWIVVGLLAELGIFIAAFEAFDAFGKNAGSTNLDAISKTLLAFGVTIWLICKAIEDLSYLDPEKLMVAASVVLVLTAIVVILAWAVLNITNKIKTLKVDVLDKIMQVVVLIAAVMIVMALSLKVISTIGKVSDAIGFAAVLVGTLVAILAVIIGFAAAMSHVAPQMSYFSATLLTIAIAIGVFALSVYLLVKAMIALPMAFTVLAASMPTLLATMDVVNNNLPTLLEKIGTALFTFLDWLIEQIPEIIIRLVEMLIGVLDGLTAKLEDGTFQESVLNFVKALVRFVLTTLAELLVWAGDSLWEMIVPVLGNIWDGFVEWIKALPGKIKDFMVKIGKAMVDAICDFLGIHSPSKVFADIGKYIVQGLLNGLKALLNIGKTIVEWVGKALSKVWDFIKLEVTGFWNIITSFGQMIIDTIKEFFGSIFGAFGDFFDNPSIESFLNIGKTIFDALVNALSGIGDWFKETFFDPILNAFKNFIGEEKWAKLCDIGNAIFGPIKDIITGVSKWFKDNLFDPISEAWNTFTSTGDVWGLITNIGGIIWSGITSALQGVGSWLWEHLWAPIQETYNSIIEKINDVLGTDFKTLECENPFKDVEEGANNAAAAVNGLKGAMTSIEDLNAMWNPEKQVVADAAEYGKYNFITNWTKEDYEKYKGYVEKYNELASKSSTAAEEWRRGMAKQDAEFASMWFHGHYLANALFDAFEETAEIESPSRRAHRDMDYIEKGFTEDGEDRKKSLADLAIGIMGSFFDTAEETTENKKSKGFFGSLLDFGKNSFDALSSAFGEDESEGMITTSLKDMVNGFKGKPLLDLIETSKRSGNKTSASFGTGLKGLLANAKNALGSVSTSMNRNTAIPTSSGKLASSASEAFRRGFSGISNITTTITSSLNANRARLIEWFREFGRMSAEGYSNGFTKALNSSSSGNSKILAGFTGVVEGVKRLLGIHSPSKVFAEIGRYVDEGFVQGIDSEADSVSSAAIKMGTNVINTVTDGMQRIDGILNGTYATPTITPVFDNSALFGEQTYLNNSFGTQGYMVTAHIDNLDQLESVATLMADYQNDNADVVRAISELQGRVDILNDNMSNLQIVMDSGVVAGALTPNISRNLGTLSQRRR